MSLERNKQIVGRYLDDVVSKGNVDLADQLMAQDLVFTSPYTPQPTRDREAFKQMIAGVHASFPDFYLAEAQAVAEGDLVASRWEAGGTHTGAPFGPLSATGRSFRITGMSVYRIRDGRISEGWVNDDTLGMATQLGLAHVAEPAGR